MYGKIMSEVVEALAELMSEMDLRHTVEEHGFYDRIVFWRRGPGDWRSPVEIMIKVESETGLDQLEWGDLEVGVQHVDLIPVGTNGWYYHLPFRVPAGTAPGGRTEVLALVEELVRNEPFYPRGRDVLNVPNSGALLSLWHELEYTLPDDAQVDVDRNGNGDETLSFDHDGRDFNIVFLANYHEGVRLLVDGEDADRCEADGHKVKAMVERHLGDLGCRRGW